MDIYTKAALGLAGKNNAQLAQIVQQSNPVTTLTHTQTQTELIKSLPVGTLDGGVDNLEIRGLSLVNSVVNGDFRDGTTEWWSTASTNATGSGVLVNTGVGTDPDPSVRQADLQSKPGDKLFLFASVHVTSAAVYLALTCFDGNYTDAKVINSPTINQWHTLCGIVTRTDTGNTHSVHIHHVYADAATASGKVMRIDGNAGVFSINMTALGIGDYTEAQMLDLVRGGYFEGLKSVENVEVKTVGKNLFDKHAVGRGYFVEPSTGDYLPDSDSFASEEIRIKENTAYTITLGLEPVQVCCYDGRHNFLSGVLLNDPATATVVSFTSPPAAKILMLSAGQVASLDILQLEEGTVATPYESYKSSRLAITPTLRSLPNGVHDKVYEAGGQVRMDKSVDELVLQSEDIVSEDTVGYSNVDLYSTSGFYGLSEIAPDGNNTIVEGFTYLAEDADDDSAFFTYRGEGTGAILFRVPKGTYPNLAVAQAALEGTVIHYQLATTELNNLSEEALTEGELQSFTNGAVYLGVGGSRALSVSFDVPTSTGAVIQSLVESSNAQAKALATIFSDLDVLYNELFPEESDTPLG